MYVVMMDEPGFSHIIQYPIDTVFFGRLSSQAPILHPVRDSITTKIISPQNRGSNVSACCRYSQPHAVAP